MYTAKLGPTWTREIADTASFDCGWYPSIAVDRTGQPWIASYDRGAGNPRVSRRNAGGGWTGEYLDTTFALRGPSGTVLPSPEPSALIVLQAPCADPFIFETTIESAALVRQILDSQPR